MRRHTALLTLIVLVMFVASTAGAQIATLTFVMPQSVDPEDLFIDAFGVTYTSVGTTPMTGNMLLSTGLGGLNTHDRIYSGTTPQIIPGLLVHSDYTGTLNVTTGINPIVGNFSPWNVRKTGSPGNYDLLFAPASGSAPLVGPQISNPGTGFYGELTAASTDPSFADSHFSVTAVPAPDSGVVLLVGLAATFAWLAVRRARPVLRKHSEARA